MYRLICTYIGSEVSSNLNTVILYVIHTCTLACVYASVQVMLALVVKYPVKPQRFLLFYSFNKYLSSTCICHESESH